MVDDIYAKMTARPTLGAAEHLPKLQLGSRLAPVSTNVIAGLIETVAAPPYHGKADLPELARNLQLEIDELFPVAEILQYLGFAEILCSMRLRGILPNSTPRPARKFSPTTSSLPYRWPSTSSACSTSAPAIARLACVSSRSWRTI
jgi:hypothetical protein